MSRQAWTASFLREMEPNEGLILIVPGGSLAALRLALPSLQRSRRPQLMLKLRQTRFCDGQQHFSENLLRRRDHGR